MASGSAPAAAIKPPTSVISEAEETARTSGEVAISVTGTMSVATS
jgi:hypothetical protein